MRLGAVLGLVLAVASCGGGKTAPGPAAPADPGPGTDPAPPAAPRPLDQADCGRLLDRFLALELAAQRASRPPEAIPTEAQIDEIRRAMAKDGMKGCVGAPRAPFDCAMAASTSPALRACLDGGNPAGDTAIPGP